MTNDFIRQELEENIPRYMVPSNYLLIDSIPLTPNAKIDKEALLKQKSVMSKKIVEPTNDIEEKILEAWKETLGDIEISTNESFSQLEATQ